MFREPWQCRTCDQPISLVTPASERCEYHAKVAAGLVACAYTPKWNSPQGGCALPSGHGGPHSPLPTRRGGLQASDVASDERREVGAALRILEGA